MVLKVRKRSFVNFDEGTDKNGNVLKKLKVDKRGRWKDPKMNKFRRSSEYIQDAIDVGKIERLKDISQGKEVTLYGFI